MTIIIDQNILWLEVSVDKRSLAHVCVVFPYTCHLPVHHIESMQALQGTKQFSCVESCPFFVESPFHLQMMKQLSTVNERQYQIEFVGALKCKLEWYNERVSHLSQHRLLCHCMRHFRTRDDTRLSQNLHGVYTICVFFAHHVHFAKTASSNHS